MNDKYMYDLLKDFEKVIVFTSESDKNEGLLRYDTPPKHTAFLFKYSECEANRTFHSEGMKFKFDIFFYDKNYRLVCKYLNVPPNKIIRCKSKSKYVVEVPE